MSVLVKQISLPSRRKTTEKKNIYIYRDLASVFFDISKKIINLGWLKYKRDLSVSKWPDTKFSQD